ncbi:hypothetical protein CDAR_548911 [Caerostris darwini]|uniref:Uncharacterized protein n=1 Tax=Caerostris darwini TaxID=1538125 RepID=A0AAV4WM82_9ARAC|nr:hypothetical protein CDAR_548911 [Caerostris darwini]
MATVLTRAGLNPRGIPRGGLFAHTHFTYRLRASLAGTGESCPTEHPLPPSFHSKESLPVFVFFHCKGGRRKSVRREREENKKEGWRGERGLS